MLGPEEMKEVDEARLKMLKNFSDKLAKIEQEMVLKDLKDKGWIYRDIRWFSPEMWKVFLDMLGERNYDLIISSETYDKNGKKCVGGQFFLSPKAIENMKEYLNKRKEIIEG